MLRRKLKAKADLLDVVEKAYLPAASDAVWATLMAESIGTLFDGVVGVGTSGTHFAVQSAHDSQKRVFRVQPTLVGGLGFAFTQEFVDTHGAANFVHMMQIEGLLDTHEAIGRRLSPEVHAMMQQFHKQHQSRDALGLVLQPEPGFSLALFCVLDKPVHLTPQQRTRLKQVGLHLEAALRLRRQPEYLHALVTHDGKVELVAPRTDNAKVRGLVEEVHRAEQARRRRSFSALDFWRALVKGEFTVMPRDVGGRPGYGVFENAPHTRRVLALSPGEARVVQHAARGLPNKLIAYALGMSEASVSRQLTAASHKLGLGHRANMLHMVATLLHNEGDREAFALTPVEEDILQLLRAGLSNREIARVRGRSEHTIANQLATLLRKTGSPNRRRLIAGFHTRP